MKTLSEVIKSYEAQNNNCNECPYIDDCYDHHVCECPDRDEDVLHHLKNYNALLVAFSNALSDAIGKDKE